MISNKLKITITVGIILFILVLIILSVSPKKNQTSQPANTTSPVKPPVAYKQGSLQKAVDLTIHKKPLSIADTAVKQRLIHLQPEGTSVYRSTNLFLFYVTAFDRFDVEIETTDIATAKKEAENWLQQQGMSQDGICNLPLTFYVNYSIAQRLQGTGIVFNPLPDECQ